MELCFYYDFVNFSHAFSLRIIIKDQKTIYNTIFVNRFLIRLKLIRSNKSHTTKKIRVHLYLIIKTPKATHDQNYIRQLTDNITYNNFTTDHRLPSPAKKSQKLRLQNINNKSTEDKPHFPPRRNINTPASIWSFHFAKARKYLHTHTLV